jgi:hypothetical protein
VSALLTHLSLSLSLAARSSRSSGGYLGPRRPPVAPRCGGSIALRGSRRSCALLRASGWASSLSLSRCLVCLPLAGESGGRRCCLDPVVAFVGAMSRLSRAGSVLYRGRHGSALCTCSCRLRRVGSECSRGDSHPLLGCSLPHAVPAVPLLPGLSTPGSGSHTQRRGPDSLPGPRRTPSLLRVGLLRAGL